MIAGRLFAPALALAFCAAGLGAVWFVYRTLQTPTMTVRPVSVAEEKPASPTALPPVEVFKLPPLSSFGATLERPVFSRNRRSKKDAPVVVSQDLALKMQGVAGPEAERRAILIPEGGGDALRLREGEEYQGWTVSEIGEKHVVFLRGDQKQRLDVNFKEKPKPGRARPAQPGARQLPGAQGRQEKTAQQRQNQLQQQRQQQRRLQQQRQQQQQLQEPQNN